MTSLAVPKPRRAFQIGSPPTRAKSPLRTRSPSRRQPWKKLLYLNQPYPDNYTNESFLSQLKRNTTVVKYSYLKLLDDFSLIAQHLSNLFLVILVFIGIYYQNWNPVTPIVYSSILTIFGFMVWDANRKDDQQHHVQREVEEISSSTTTYSLKTQRSKIKSSIILLFILLILSPVLKSLTKSTASDSIWAISFCLCIANTLFHEYAMASDLANCRPIISTNISFSSAIVLASRLSTNISVFCFVLFAIQANILLPVFDVHLRQFYPKAYHRSLFVATSIVVSIMVAFILNIKILLIWVMGQVGIVFVLPSYFLFLQKYKNELQGPWDPAKPIIKTT
ncbi:phosphatidylinositol N-acetylglucosaminyltransferase Gpi2p subunit [[Candida] railenensis]|uniref:Phosphatidylinositol N-acetylglucosaminyltransferase Gpi2p subunit n=1 Tax=[Candida] railenensis TaxID=45579 RepID=A0A9P0QKI2_9ASCO|nr:phosphatidylinositol N-acetylglucosaminyltransferase Gpi2p subunit [[Candida] railenensis]